MVSDLIEPLEYYSVPARKAEIAKYSSDHLHKLIQQDPASVLVAKAQADLAGFCISEYDDGLLWICWFGVQPKWRRQGVVSALLHELERTASSRGCHKIWCDCRSNNEPSKAVLTRNGFKQICSVTNHWYGQDFILWEKPIS